MKTDSVVCDDLLLIEKLNSVENAESTMLDHVESCVQCQNRLRAAAANEDEWKKASSALQPDHKSDSPAQTNALEQPPGTAFWQSRPLVWNETMAEQILEPPTHPELLGRLKRYEIERLIGSGGMGLVFKAYDTELNRPVAIKMLAPYLAANESARKRFAREARAAAGVVDDHVVPIHNVESENDPPFLVMQFVAGGSLQEKLDTDGPLDVTEILRIGIQTAKGLSAAHTQGLIHRDVKPSNILLDEGIERALLTDFGLARAENDASLTHSGFQPGTPDYMSPEQVRGETIDYRSDLFSLGCVLYALCTGDPPFKADTSFSVMRRITDDSFTPISDSNATIPEWLSDIINRLLEKDRDLRFQSAESVAELLEGCLAHKQQPMTVPLPNSVMRRRQIEPTENHLKLANPKETAASSKIQTTKTMVGISILIIGLFVALEFANMTSFFGTAAKQQDEEDQLSEKVKIILHRQKGKKLKLYVNSRDAYVNGRSVTGDELDTIVRKSGLKSAVISAESYVGNDKIANLIKTLREAGIREIKHARPEPKETEEEKISRIVAQQKGNYLRIYLKGTTTVYANGTQVSLDSLKAVIKKSKSKTATLSSALEVVPSRLSEIEKWLQENGVITVKREGNAAKNMSLKEVVQKSKEKAKKDRDSNLRTIASRQTNNELQLYLGAKGAFINGRSVTAVDVKELVNIAELKTSVISAEPYLNDRTINQWKDVIEKAGIKSVKVVRLQKKSK